MTSLDERMNQDIDRLIAKLEEIKSKQGGYSKKAIAVGQVGEEAKNYASFWEEKLNDWATD